MNSIAKLGSYDLGPRQTASDYIQFYRELRDEAHRLDNKSDLDLSNRAGEVVVRDQVSDDKYVNFGFQRDEIYVGESLGLSYTQIKGDGKRGRTETVDAGLLDRSEEKIRFNHRVDEDGDFRYESIRSFIVDGTNGTITELQE